MQIQRLKLREFRNLRDFEIHFTGSAADADGTERRFKSHAVIGQNGSGKSNLLEAIVTIFRDLDLNLIPAFDYELDYEVRGYRIAIKAGAASPPRVEINGEPTDPWELSDTHRRNPATGQAERGKARRYLPSNVFAYYSGKSGRLEALFQEHQRHFIDNLNAQELEDLDREAFDERQESDGLLRRLFYCRHPHSRLVLLALLLAPEQPLRQVLDDLKIVDVDSALFVLKQPYRLTGESLTPEDIRQGNVRFWYDRTRFTDELLDKLWELAVAPIDHIEEKVIDFRGRVEEQALLYLFVDSREKLEALKQHVGDSYRFFRFLEGAYVADLLDDLKIFVSHRGCDGLLTFEQLSEGELQLLTVLGLMRLTHQDHCLFLLDEPDTHLNPLWKLRYFEHIERVLKKESDGPLTGDSQILVTTHDPMMVGSLRREQVRILRPDCHGRVEVDVPTLHPQGMGVAALLKSDLFGLSSTLDTETQRRLFRRNALYAKGDRRTPEEEDEMRRLSAEFADLGFAQDFKDPLYALFVRKMGEHTQFHKPDLTPEEIRDQDALAKSIVDKILEEESRR